MERILPIEKQAQRARIELEKIVFRLERYCKEHHYHFAEGIEYLSAKLGYKKYNYIPIDNEEIYQVSQDSLRYMRIYALKPTQFFTVLYNLYENIQRNGYTIDISQKTLGDD